MTLWKIQDVAEYLRVKVPTAYKVVNKPGFPRSIKIAGRRWNPQEVERWALRQRD